MVGRVALRCRLLGVSQSLRLQILDKKTLPALLIVRARFPDLVSNVESPLGHLMPEESNV